MRFPFCAIRALESMAFKLYCDKMKLPSIASTGPSLFRRNLARYTCLPSLSSKSKLCLGTSYKMYRYARSSIRWTASPLGENCEKALPLLPLAVQYMRFITCNLSGLQRCLMQTEMVQKLRCCSEDFTETAELSLSLLRFC